MVTFEARYTVDPELFDAVMDGAIRVALHEVMANDVLPEIRNTAPGSIGPKVRMGKVSMVEPGIYRITVRMPGKYRAVEEGSGIYGPDGMPYLVVPRKAKALKFEDGGFAASAMVQGQPGQRFIHNALQKYALKFARIGLKEFKSDLAGFAARSVR